MKKIISIMLKSTEGEIYYNNTGIDSLVKKIQNEYSQEKEKEYFELNNKQLDGDADVLDIFNDNEPPKFNRPESEALEILKFKGYEQNIDSNQSVTDTPTHRLVITYLQSQLDVITTDGANIETVKIEIFEKK